MTEKNQQLLNQIIEIYKKLVEDGSLEVREVTV